MAWTPSAGLRRSDRHGDNVIGYTSRFSVAPGEQLAFMVSGDGESAEARLVRLIHGDQRSPIGLLEREVASSLDGVWSLSRQVVRPGSFGVIARADPVSAAAKHELSGHVFVCPTLLHRPAPQGVLAQVNADGGLEWELAVENGGDLVVRTFAGGEVSGCARIVQALREDVWSSVSFTIDHPRRMVNLWSTSLSGIAAGSARSAGDGIRHERSAAACGGLLLAARRLAGGRGEPRALDTFNGKLERPALFSGTLDCEAAGRLAAGASPETVGMPVVLDLDLGAQSGGWELVDRSRCDHAGRVYNAPLRGCTSHTWRGDTRGPAVAPVDYAAIHFHEDDVHHANWQPTREWIVPEGLSSGLYALRLRSDEGEDRIPFIVRPPRDHATQAVALWLPSFTYAAYANARECMLGTPYGDFSPERTEDDALLTGHPEWGGSTYDVHADGSGIAISSLARPVPNLRPTHRVGLVNGPRHLAADLYLIHWLERINVGVDVIGDEDVHADGCELLRRYATVITGGHPEYVTARELDALEEYTDRGGRLMYMGGNGFYWVTTVAPEAATTVEVRRGQGGTRTWDAAPGEHYHQFTGEPGGLWRYRGRPPHAIVGIGFVGEGWDGKNRPYHRRPESFRPAAAWVFEGVAADGPIGDGGLVMGGAAGDEVDSADHIRGTPPETLVLASSGGHSDAYWLAVEDILWGREDLTGSKNPRIRADMALTAKRNGGAVFAVGSISWAGSLSHRDYRNPVARLSENVLRTFASGGSPWIGSVPPDRLPASDGWSR